MLEAVCWVLLAHLERSWRHRFSRHAEMSLLLTRFNDFHVFKTRFLEFVIEGSAKTRCRTARLWGGPGVGFRAKIMILAEASHSKHVAGHLRKIGAPENTCFFRRRFWSRSKVQNDSFA